MNEFFAGVFIGAMLTMLLALIIHNAVSRDERELHDTPAEAWVLYQEQVEFAEMKYREAFGK